jgi:hypothetical protein
MHKVYGHKLDGAETSIDATDELVACCAQILILLDILTRRHGKLRKHNLSDPLWVLSEEEFKCMKLLRNALDIIKSIDPDNDLHAIESLLKSMNALLNGLFLQILWAHQDYG